MVDAAILTGEVHKLVAGDEVDVFIACGEGVFVGLQINNIKIFTAI